MLSIDNLIKECSSCEDVIAKEFTDFKRIDILDHFRCVFNIFRNSEIQKVVNVVPELNERQKVVFLAISFGLKVKDLFGFPEVDCEYFI